MYGRRTAVASSTTSTGTRRILRRRARRRPGARLGGRPRTRGPATGFCAATASTSRPAASRTARPPRAGRPPGSPRRADDRARRAVPRRPTARASRGSRVPTIPCVATASRDRGDRVRPGPAPSGRVGGTADDPLPRSGRRGEAAAPARNGPARGAFAPVRTGGRILVDQLELNGADLAFCLPGESYLPVLDALYDSPIRLVTCRHEQGAANAAEAYGKLTGRPGICLVTRGPGATQAAVGVHTAKQDSSPMLLLVGPGATRLSRTGGVAGARLRAGLRRASRRPRGSSTAPSGSPSTWRKRSRSRCRAGPGRSCSRFPRTCLPRRRTSPTERRVEVAAHRAQRRGRGAAARAAWTRRSDPSSSWARAAGRRRRRVDVLAFCEANELPVACAFRCQDFVDNRSPSYVGVLGVAMDERLAARLRDADLVLAVGGRLGEVPTRRYTLLEPPRPEADARPRPSRSGRARTACTSPTSRSPRRCPRWRAALRGLEPVEPRWREWTESARADYERNLRHEPMEGDVDLGEIMAFLRATAPRRRGPDLRRGQLHRLGASLCPVHPVRDAGVPA